MFNIVFYNEKTINIELIKYNYNSQQIAENDLRHYLNEKSQDENGKNYKKYFIDNVDQLYNKISKDGYYIIENNNKFYVYTKSTIVESGWISNYIDVKIKKKGFFQVIHDQINIEEEKNEPIYIPPTPMLKPILNKKYKDLFSHNNIQTTNLHELLLKEMKQTLDKKFLKIN